MAQYGGARMDIEDFASTLFKEWGIGTSTGTSLEESMGVLLLFSRLDRKSRIEMGPGWGPRDARLAEDPQEGAARSRAGS